MCDDALLPTGSETVPKPAADSGNSQDRRLTQIKYRTKNATTVVATMIGDISMTSSENKCLCPYSGEEFGWNDGKVLGAVVPQCTVSYLCHPTLADKARGASIKLFHTIEQNCNTCRHLERVKFEKKQFVITGLMPGVCKNPNGKPLYNQGFPNIYFAPDDCMLQSCYEGR
jgi:hypothetical protein